MTGGRVAVEFGDVALLAAYDAGPVTVVDPLASTAPVFTAVFAALLLRETERVTAGVVVGVVGIVAGTAPIAVV